MARRTGILWPQGDTGTGQVCDSAAGQCRMQEQAEDAQVNVLEAPELRAKPDPDAS